MPARGGRVRPRATARGASRPATRRTAPEPSTEAGPSAPPGPPQTTRPETPVPAGPSNPTPASAPAQRPATRSSRGASASKSSGPRFRPNVVRRSEAQRRELAEEETRKQEQYAQQENRQLRRATRGRGMRGRGRGRGDIRGRGRGVFTGGAGATSAAGPIRPTRIKLESLMDDDDLPQGDRLNADRLYQLSNEMEESSPGQSATRSSNPMNGIRPVGLIREPHKQKELVVATTAELEARGSEDTKAAVAAIIHSDDRDSTPEEERISPEELAKAQELAKLDTRPWENAPTGEVPMLKTEDGTMRPMNIDDAVMIAEKAAKDEQAAAKQKEAKLQEMDNEQQATIADIATILGELGIDKDDPEGKPESKEGLLYLFQFPPIFPKLVPKQVSSVAKTESGDDDLSILDAPPAGDKTNKAVDLVAGELTDKGPLATESGYVGKMVVRKSGKVELNWGGFPMEVSRGASTEFSSNAVIVETDDVKNQGQEMGRVYDMGSIVGKYIVAPVFNEDKGWEYEENEIS